MTSDTATSPILQHSQTTLILRGRGRLTANAVWYILFAAWMVYFLFGWRFAVLRAETFVCLPFMAALSSGVLPTCVAVTTAAEALGQIVFLTAAIILFLRKPYDLMTVMASAVLLFLSAGISNITLAYSTYPETAPISRTMLGFSLWITAVFFLLFPDGRFRLSWAWLVVVAQGVWALSWWFAPSLDLTRTLNVATYPLFALSMLPATYAVWLGYKRTFTPTQQQQTKWVIFGVVGTVTIYLAFTLTALVAKNLFGDSPTGLAVYVASVYGRWVALVLIPVTIVFSIARYHLWDVDLVISRALVTGGVSLVLALVFIAAVLAVQRIAIAVTGVEQSSIAVAVASLAVAVLFNPLRARLTTVIDRRFFPKSLEAARQVTLVGSETQPKTVAHAQPAGTTFGQYEIVELIGRGGMAEVYKAQQKGIERTAAVKVLNPSLAQDPRFRARFTRESHTISTMDHPNIVKVYDSGEANGTFYMAMEYIRGENLAVYLKHEGWMPPKQAIPLLRDVAGALDYAHEHGVVHRDVKPANIMLQVVEATTPDARRFRPVLMDFGIVRLVGSHTALTLSPGALGTLDYMSPEQILESSRVDRRADIYSLGVVAFQIFTGKLPFHNESPALIILNHLQKPAPDPRKLNPDVPASVAEAILRAMAKDPEKRPQTAGEFVEALA